MAEQHARVVRLVFEVEEVSRSLQLELSQADHTLRELLRRAPCSSKFRKATSNANLGFVAGNPSTKEHQSAVTMAARTLDPPEPETANLGQPKKRSRTTTDEVEGSRKSAKKGKSKAADGGAPPLGKYLASNGELSARQTRALELMKWTTDKTTRDRAVAALGTFLSGGSRKASAGSSSSASLFTSSNISASNTLEWPANAISDADPRLADAELAKLYKGLFYCFWMSDKPLAQHSLAEALSTLCLAVRPPATLSRDLSDGENVILTTRSALQYWKGFWTALEVEWNGIDRHRMDKYLMWVRKYWNVGLRLLERVAWRREAVEEWTRIVRATVLR